VYIFFHVSRYLRSRNDPILLVKIVGAFDIMLQNPLLYFNFFHLQMLNESVILNVDLQFI